MSRIRSEEGAVAVLTAVLAIVLFGIAALVVDLGVARDNRRQAQNTADASALAAANALYGAEASDLNKPGNFDAAVTAAKEYAAQNYGTTEAEWAGCSNSEALDYVYPGTGTNCISFDKSPFPNNVLVTVPLRKQPTLFGGIVGYSGVEISALAQARIAPGISRICTFCVIQDDETHNLQNGNLSVTGGNLYFNGNVDIGPNGSAISSTGQVLGEDGLYYDDGGNAYVSGDISGSSTKFQDGNGQSRQPKAVDPLAATELPFATQETLIAKSNPCTDGPGIYDGYDQNNSVCTLQPGLYVFTDDVSFAGNPSSQLIAEGVTMYFTCGTVTSPQPCASPGEDGAALDLSGNGSYSISPPLRSTVPEQAEELWGFSIVYDRYNTSNLELSGNGSGSLDGTVYAVNSTLRFSGNGGALASTSMFVIGSIDFNGNNVTLDVDFDATKNRKPSDAGRGLVR